MLLNATSINLNGMTTVVTGGGTGLGRAMSLALADAGSDVVIAGRRTGPINDVLKQIEGKGKDALAVSADLTESSQVDVLFEKTLARFGKVDALINNAGMVGEQGGKPIWEITDSEFRLGIDANLTSAFYCSRAISKHMVDRKKGTIINVASGFGFRGGRNSYVYGCSKGGVIQLTRILATSLGRYGVTCNCIVPGYFPTEGTATSTEILPKSEHIPVGRAGDPSELGPIAVFLVSEASTYMNGTFFGADGGGLAGGYAPTGPGPIIPIGK